MPTFQRTNIRLPSLHYLGKRDYFVTVCCEKRRPYLAKNEDAAPVLEYLQSSAARESFAIHAYCAMPDHLHFLASGTSDVSNMLTFVNSFKQYAAYEFLGRTGKQLWQYKFYDHILRPGNSIENVAWYIWQNPVRKNLCANPRDYPFSGSFSNAIPLLKSTESNWIPPWKENL
jgi:putative transposase